MSLQRPTAALRPFASALWAHDVAHARRESREHVLPAGAMHVSVRLGNAPLRLFRDAADGIGEGIARATVCGAREAYYIKLEDGSPSVGAVLRPGAAQALLRCDAVALAGRHVDLEDVWGRAIVERLRGRLLAATGDAGRIALLEQALLERLQTVRAMHPAIAQALRPLRDGAAVHEVVAAGGLSHRHFIARFRAAIGLGPKAYARIQRLRRVRALLAAGRPLDAAALDAGFSDQSHLNREFQALAGITPAAYRRAAVRGGAHVPVNFLQDPAAMQR